MRCLLLTAALFATVARAQQPLLLLDPARGGNDNGPAVAQRTPEKAVTLTLANRLAPMLRARGFAVEFTRDGDTEVSSEARAALANTTHPIACFLLHAASAGTGIHLYTTTLHAPAEASDATGPAASKAATWDEAQAAFADRSRMLAGDLRSAFVRGKLPVSLGQTWMRPLDNMQCAAVAIEVSPLDNSRAPDDLTYQGHIADTLASVALAWRARVDAMSPPTPRPPATVAEPKPSAPLPGAHPSAPLQPAPTGLTP